jgi:hypothetical protein
MIDTTNDSDTNTKNTFPSGWIASVCNCGCSKVTVPFHLRNEQLYIRVHPSKYGQPSIRFSLNFAPNPETQHGNWKKLSV